MDNAYVVVGTLIVGQLGVIVAVVKGGLSLAARFSALETKVGAILEKDRQTDAQLNKISSEISDLKRDVRGLEVIVKHRPSGLAGPA